MTADPYKARAYCECAGAQMPEPPAPPFPGTWQKLYQRCLWCNGWGWLWYVDTRVRADAPTSDA
jgi:hypothetical protein